LSTIKTGEEGIFEELYGSGGKKERERSREEPVWRRERTGGLANPKENIFER
jgi:hypothetical protein